MSDKREVPAPDDGSPAGSSEMSHLSRPSEIVRLVVVNCNLGSRRSKGETGETNLRSDTSISFQ